MKILALTAVNLNSKYLSCVPYFIDFWLSLKPERRSITYVPKVMVMADSLPKELESYKRWCEVFPLDSTIPSAFGSQAVRILQPSMESADYVITTDVDMLPLSDRVFQAALDEVEAGVQFVVCRDVLPKGQYAICYNLASPNAWREVSGIKSLEEVHSSLIEMLKRIPEGSNYSGDHGGEGWFTDQEVLFSMVNDFEAKGGRVAKLRDKQTRHKRLDRLFMPFPISWLFLPGLYWKLFTDYHVHHPIDRYEKYLKALEKFRDSGFQRQS